MKQPYHHGALRQALLDAAEAILDRDGIDALTLRAAAREAGVSHGAPAHHFGDLTGLLTELAASGFVRLRQAIEAEAAQEADRERRIRAMGRGYVRFARNHPGIFLLMFRSERLNWSSPSLSEAGEMAFALLTQSDSDRPVDPSNAVRTLTLATTRWSLMHGLATLIVDGRLGAFVDKLPRTDIEQVIEDVLVNGLRS